MTDVMQVHVLQDPEDILYWQFYATKLVSLMAYLGETLAAGTRENCEPPAFWPWPAYPFGHPDFESWAAARHPIWLDSHREHGAALVELARTAQAMSNA